ncbi:glycoside hydrolase family 127 protein [Enterococcus sp. LJL120]
MREFSLKEVKMQDDFWRGYQKLVANETIPYQYQVLNDEIEVDVQAEREDNNLPAGKSHALANLRIAAGQEKGEHFGWFFQDSDVYKWLESLAYSLLNQPDATLEKLADEVIDLIADAQEADGYLNTFFQLTRPNLKYRQLYFSHELYCAGHLIEAAIAYDLATGKTKLLAIAEKFVEHIAAHFGTEPQKIQGADGHQEIELALVRLYEHTGNKDHLSLADFFIDVRGKDPEFYAKKIAENIELGLSTETLLVNLEYLQAYTQPKYQTQAKGHAVRMLYMASGMAKIAQHTADKPLLAACEAIWQDIAETKMYITGGVGSTVQGEAFTGSYDLPNETMYCETCAAIALANFSFEMFKLTSQHQYLETMERALYNCVLAGAAIDGKHFFYVNPLSVNPDHCAENPDLGHVKSQRPDWLGCACCPPNFARTVASVQHYFYTRDEKALYVNLFGASQIVTADFQLQQKTDFPYDNQISLIYQGIPQKIILRKPSWWQNLEIKTDGKYQEFADYLEFQGGTQLEIQLTFSQQVKAMIGNPLLQQTINQTAIQRGPFVYCLEEAGNEFSVELCHLQPKDLAAEVFETADILPRTLNIKVQGTASKPWQEKLLYQEYFKAETATVWHLIPYHLWGNRGLTKMKVWLPLQSS